jgi:hypothetical protein
VERGAGERRETHNRWISVCKRPNVSEWMIAIKITRMG